MKRNAIVAAFAPLAFDLLGLCPQLLCAFLIVRIGAQLIGLRLQASGLIQLVIGVVPNGFGGVGAEGVRDLYLRTGIKFLASYEKPIGTGLIGAKAILIYEYRLVI